MAAFWMLPSLLAFLIASTCHALPKADLYPYGREEYLPTNDDVSSPEVPLTVPIVFYGTSYRTIYVNDNGLLSFLTEVPSFFNAQFPLTYPIIAPLYSDGDTRAAGRIYYRETQERELLDRAAREVRGHFSSASAFQPRSLFIVTWEGVGYFERAADKANTFQVVIASDEEDSYALFLYPAGGVEWIQSQGKNPNLPDARAQAGFMSGDGRLYTLRGSGTEQARNFDRMSNAKKAGVWLFHIGRPSGGNVLPPDLDEDAQVEEGRGGAVATCADTLLPCPPHATCRDNPSGGFCCVCKDNFFGNGRNCVEKNSPQRMNGKVSGMLNDVPLQEADLHAYIVTEDGRTYTAVSRVPSALGPDLQVLTPLGAGVGWLFAVPRSQAPNGFEITGGAFNRTVEVDFPQSGDHVYIEETFLGPDVFNYMRVQVKLRGSVPSVPVGSKIEVPDYEEEYTRVSPGLIRSHASRSYRLEGNSLEVPFTLDQSISFSECQPHPLSSTRLKVARNFIVYDPQEQIVRYAMTNKISPLAVDDPCKEGRLQCGPNSNCVAEGDSFRCACNQGYQSIYEAEEGGAVTCIDVNECELRRHNCHIFAECINLPGSFLCRCNQGYTGDGTNCERKRSCADVNCDPNADCVEEGGREPRCRCRVGFAGDGQSCEPADADDCRSVNFCDQRADCLYQEQTHRFVCQCRQGFTGDGIVCVEDSCDVAQNCSPDGSCLLDAEGGAYYCACRPGFSGDGYNCRPAEGGLSCDVVNNCHPFAQCLYDPYASRYQCRCDPGYRGDGLSCSKSPDELDQRQSLVGCDQLNDCSPFALCVREEYTGRFVCQCTDGFEGDGHTCSPVDQCNTPADCDANAECVFDPSGQLFSCKCLPGFSGSGRTCYREESACDACHRDADCVFDGQRHRCVCARGFRGDGLRCEKEELPCNVINSCHVRAECQFDGRTHRCRCQPGYEGDGRDCHPVRSCLEDRFQCDRNAECQPYGPDGRATCACKQGYIGDGITCTPSQQHDGGGSLVFAHGMSLLRVPSRPSKSDPGRLLLMEPGQTPVGLATDCQGGALYWADASLKVIRRAFYNGSDVSMVVEEDMLSPEGVAVDWLGRNIYWTDSGKDTIEVASLERKYRKVLVAEDLGNPRGIAVHPGLGKMYWTDWIRSGPKIESANLDGTGRSVLVKDNLGLPNMVVIDFSRNNLCWTDSGLRRIECIALNGQSRRVVYTPAAYPFGIAIHEGYIYWTDWEIKFLHRVDVNGGEAEPIEIPAGGSGKMYGLVSLPNFCPPASSPCAVDNGGCKYLCLPDGRGGRSCVCPDMGEGEDNFDCNEAS